MLCVPEYIRNMRRRHHVQAKQQLLSIFQSLPEEEQTALIDPKGNHKQAPQETKVTETSTAIDLISEDAKSASPRSKQSSPKKQAENEENDVVGVAYFSCHPMLICLLSHPKRPAQKYHESKSLSILRELRK